MQSYRVRVTEKHTDYVYVQANSVEEALKLAPTYAECEFDGVYDCEVIGEYYNKSGVGHVEIDQVPPAPTDILSVGDKIVLEWGTSTCTAEIVAVTDGRHYLEMDWGGSAIMDTDELIRRKFVLLYKKKQLTWLL